MLPGGLPGTDVHVVEEKVFDGTSPQWSRYGMTV